MNFIDLPQQYRRYKAEILEEMGKVLETAQFIMGPAVGELEAALAAQIGIPHAIGCASGTDALLLSLMALGVKRGDEVIVPDFTFFATAEVVAFLGAVPVFADVRDDTYNIDASRIASKITARTRGVIPVGLFGQCADMDEVNALGRTHHLWVLEDAAQSYGALYKGKKSCAVSEIAATSFFPAKPLGCYGDGGAVFTGNGDLARHVRELLNHGQTERYKHGSIGINGRLDTLQAAVLKVKLRHFDEEMAMKQTVAARYIERLDGRVRTPAVLPGNRSVWAQFTIRSPKRDAIAAGLKARGIPTAVHYPIPLHRQEAFAALAGKDSDFPVSLKACSEVISLPMHPFMTAQEVDAVCDAILEAV